MPTGTYFVQDACVCHRFLSEPFHHFCLRGQLNIYFKRAVNDLSFINIFISGCNTVLFILFLGMYYYTTKGLMSQEKLGQISSGGERTSFH
jgi:hypothetical protein